MKYIVPNYLLSFKCDGKICQSYCCRQWKITIDEYTKSKYDNLPFKDGIISHIGEKEGDFYPLKLKENGFCPFLRNDFLCNIQKNLGEDFLSNICYSYPRVTTKIKNTIFQSLTLSCPVAARLVLFENEMTFIETSKPPSRLGWCVEKNIANDHVLFEDIVSAGLFILKNNAISIDIKLKMLLDFYKKAYEYENDEQELNNLLNSVENNSFQDEFLNKKNSSYIKDYIFNKDEFPKLMLTIFNSIYDAPITEEKHKSLSKIYHAYFNEFQTNIIDNNHQIFTNYLMNEFFMRVYPYAFKENFSINIRVFILSWYALKFALFMLYMEHFNLDEEKLILGVQKLTERLDHGQGVLKKFIAIAKDFC